MFNSRTENMPPKNGSSSSPCRKQRGRADQEWRNRPSARHKATATDIENTIDKLRRYLAKAPISVPERQQTISRMEHTLRVEKRDSFELDSGHGGYKTWLDGKRFSSMYQLARHFCPALPDTMRDGKKRNRRDVPSPRMERDDEEDEDEDENESAEDEIRVESESKKQRKNDRDDPLTLQRALELLEYNRKEMERQRKEMERQRKEIERLRKQHASSTRDDHTENREDEGEKKKRKKRNDNNQGTAADDQGVIEDEDDDGFDGIFDPLPRVVDDPARRTAEQLIIDMMRPPVIEEDITLEIVEEKVFDKLIPWYNNTSVPLRTACTFDSSSVLEAFTFRGATLATSIEQSSKTMMMAALAILCSMKERPCMLLCGLQCAQVAELEGKLSGILLASGIHTTFLNNGEAQWNKFKENPTFVNEFKTGKRLVITPGYAMARVSLLEEVDARNALMLLDESDEIFTRDTWNSVSKEETCARVIGEPHSVDSRVTGVVFVSATHLADLHVLNKALRKVPKTFICVDLEELRQKGYTTHEDLELFARVEPDYAKKEYQHGLTSPAFRSLMHDFKTCAGRRKLMLVASCPRVNAGDSTLSTQAEKILEYDPEALVVTHFAGKCYLNYRMASGKIKLKVRIMERGNKYALARAERRTRPIKTVQKALELLQNRFTNGDNNDKRFVVIGYNALSRSTSTRTNNMVPTHMFALLGKGRHSADLRQTMMRPAGKSTEVRHANGHGRVKIVAPEADWHLIQTLYAFQNAVCERTTDDPNFDFESYKNYSVHTRPVVESERSHTRRTMRLKNAWEINPSTESKAEYEEEQRQFRNELREKEKERERQLQPTEEDEDEGSHEDGGEHAHEDRDFINDGSDLEEYSDSGSLEQGGSLRHGVDMQSKVLMSMFRFSDSGRNDIRLRDLHGTCLDVAQYVASQHNIYERLRNKGFIRHISSGVYTLTKSGIDYCSR